MIFKKIRMEHGWYNNRKEFAKWVKKNLGAEYVNEALKKYDILCSGSVIGGLPETAMFVNMIEQAKKEF